MVREMNWSAVYPIAGTVWTTKASPTVYPVAVGQLGIQLLANWLASNWHRETGLKTRTRECDSRCPAACARSLEGTPLLPQPLSVPSSAHGDLRFFMVRADSMRTDVAVALQTGLCLQPAFTLASCSAYSIILKMEAICSSKTSVNF
jgi:hypothetical protein